MTREDFFIRTRGELERFKQQDPVGHMQMAMGELLPAYWPKNISACGTGDWLLEVLWREEGGQSEDDR